jgi:hypothetical protein
MHFRVRKPAPSNFPKTVQHARQGPTGLARTRRSWATALTPVKPETVPHGEAIGIILNLLHSRPVGPGQVVASEVTVLRIRYPRECQPFHVWQADRHEVRPRCRTGLRSDRLRSSARPRLLIRGADHAARTDERVGKLVRSSASCSRELRPWLPSTGWRAD